MTDNYMEHFELPYPEWHDEQGRIYKDVLIKNFNAIENKINEILSIDIDSFTKPDISAVVYPDVDLQSGDDTSILNLKSFLEITNLINFPLVVKTDGNNKVTRVEYWGDDYVYHTITNSSVVANSSNPYIYLDYGNKEIIRSSSYNTPTNCVLVAILKDNKLITNNLIYEGNVDFVRVLTEQARKYDSRYGQKQYSASYNGQTVFGADSESKGSPMTGYFSTQFLENSLRDVEKGGNE